MRPLFLLVIFLLAGSCTAAAQGTAGADDERTAGAGEVTLTLFARTDGGRYWFEREAGGAPNPDLHVPRGARVNVTLINVEAQLHDFHVEGFGQSAFVREAGESTTFSFVAPADDVAIRYWCDPHRTLGMAGLIGVGDAEAPPPRAVPPAGLALVVAGVGVAAALARRTAPARGDSKRS